MRLSELPNNSDSKIQAFSDFRHFIVSLANLLLVAIRNRTLPTSIELQLADGSKVKLIGQIPDGRVILELIEDGVTIKAVDGYPGINFEVGDFLIEHLKPIQDKV